MIAICPQCNNGFETKGCYINRAKSINAPLYCGRVCAGLGRRDKRTTEQKKADKAAYDKQFRSKNFDEIKSRKQAYDKTPQGREAQKRRRNTRMPKHVEYCRDPEYKAKKVEYDKVHQAKVNAGEFWESYILINEINKKLTQMADKAELRTIQGTNNKSKKRKRAWLRLMTNLRQLT